MGFFVPLVGWGAAALGGATGLTATAGRAFKEQLGWSELDAAREELMQGKYKGYNPSTGKINRSWIEGIRDDLLGNDAQEIQRLTRDLQTENVTDALGPEVAEVNRLVREAGGDEQITIDYNSTNRDVQRQIDRLKPKAQAVLQGQADAPDAGITMNTPTPQIAVRSREGQRNEANLAILESPIYQQQLRDAQTARETADRRFNATQQLAIAQMGIAQQQQANQMQIAQMNNQLQMRRQDSADRRADRRDRQAMIQQLMSGLSALGTSIAV